MTAHYDHPIDEATGPWHDFARSLAEFLTQMTVDEDGSDHLVLDLPSTVDGVTRPYAQIAFYDDDLLYAELTGNAYLPDQYRLDDAACAALRARGWSGNDERADADGADGAEINWHIDRPVHQARTLADDIVWAFSTLFGIAHPQLLLHNAWGPTAGSAVTLGLCAHDDIPTEPELGAHSIDADDSVGAGGAERADHDRVVPIDTRADLQEAVRELLTHRFGTAPELDDDGDFPLEHHGQQLWVQVPSEAPAVQITARVAHDVRSRRSTAVELTVLNGNDPWIKWTLRGRNVWQTAILPGSPFVPAHLAELLDHFCHVLDQGQEDLLLRTGGKCG